MWRLRLSCRALPVASAITIGSRVFLSFIGFSLFRYFGIYRFRYFRPFGFWYVGIRLDSGIAYLSVAAVCAATLRRAWHAGLFCLIPVFTGIGF